MRTSFALGQFSICTTSNIFNGKFPISRGQKGSTTLNILNTGSEKSGEPQEIHDSLCLCTFAFLNIYHIVESYFPNSQAHHSLKACKCTGHHYTATFYQRQWNKLQPDLDNEKSVTCHVIKKWVKRCKHCQCYSLVTLYRRVSWMLGLFFSIVINVWRYFVDNYYYRLSLINCFILMGDDENGRECSIGSWESLLSETDDTLLLPPFADQDFHPISARITHVSIVWR